MKKAIKNLMVLMLSCGISLTSLSFVAYAQNNDSKSKEIEYLQKSNLIDTKIKTIDVKVEKENENYIVKCYGYVRNNSGYFMKDIKVKVQLVNLDKKVIGEIDVDNITNLNLREQKDFKVEKYITVKNTSFFEIRAIPKILNLEKTDILEIAEWFLNGEKGKLDFWSIAHNEKELENEASRKIATINFLLKVTPNNSEYYKKIADKINQIYYEESLKSIIAEDYEYAFKNLLSINQEREYGQKVNLIFGNYRAKIIHEKVKTLIEKKDYYTAISLLRSINPEDKLYYNRAQTELTKIYSIPEIKDLKYNLPKLDGYTKTQKEVISIMEMQPEFILKNVPSKGMTRLVFPDYSYFNFDKTGTLQGYKIYPLY